MTAEHAPRICGKIEYETRAQADRAKRYLHAKPRFTEPRAGRSNALHAYHCPHCGFFHLGRQLRGRHMEFAG
jgi:hypothetical protein